MTTILIKDAQIVTMNRDGDILTGDILIENDRITAIGPDLNPAQADKIIDAKNRTVIPGFIQTHIHFVRRCSVVKGTIWSLWIG